MKRVLNDWISSAIKYTHNSEPPELFRKWIAVSVVASCLQRKCFLPWGSLTFYPNMYIVLVAPSGAARKGTAMGPGMDFLTEPGLGVKLAAEAITREALIRELKNASDNAINSETGQMMFHASLTIYSQELTVFLGYNNMQLMSDLTDWYDCRKKWTYRTKWSGSDEIEGVWVNLIGATTPKLIQSSMPVDAIGLGLTSRIIFIYQEKKGKIIPDPFLTRGEVELRHRLVADLEKIANLSGPFHVTGEFVELWTDWYLSQEGSPPFQDDRFAGYFERRPTHVMKLSIILNASRTDSMIITDGDLKRAIGLLEETEITMPKTFSGLGKSSQADILARCMAEIGNRGHTSFTELMNFFKYDTTKWELEKVLETLYAMKYCFYATNTGEITYNKDFEKEIPATFVKSFYEGQEEKPNEEI
jgi:hypothetical protein